MGPAYIKSILNVKMGRTSLRSGASTVLEVPKTKLVRCGDIAFCKTAPVLWNDLTHELKLIEKLDTFKSRLKTKLFIEYYE